MSEPLPADFAAALASSASRRGPFGDPVFFFSETASTNDIAAALAERGAPEGATVIALAQTAGRGRLGRTWYSPPGAGLYVSVISRSAAAAPYLTLAGGVAVAEGIRRATALPVAIKWPNDIVISDPAAPGGFRKIAGILAEASSGAEGIQHVILGFGINLRSTAYPPEIAARASSIELELGREPDGPAVLAETLASLASLDAFLSAGNPAAVLARWRALAPSARGTVVQWESENRTVTGVSAGIAEDGALLVEVGDRVERIVAGELRWGAQDKHAASH